MEAQENQKPVQKSAGVDEIKAVLTATNAIALHLIQGAKGGAVADAEALVTSFFTDADFKNKVVSAVQNINQLGAEIKDLNAEEGIDLAVTEFQNTQQILAALK